MASEQKTLTTSKEAALEKQLWKAADKLQKNIDAEPAGEAMGDAT